MAIVLGDLIINLTLEDEDLKKEIKDAEKELNEFESRVDKVGRGIQDMGAKLTAVLTLPLIAGAALAVKAAAEMEVLQLQFETMLQSEALALSLMEDIKRFSAGTPFQIQEIANAAGVLITMGRTIDQVKEDLKSFGDVAAGTPASLEDLANIMAKIIGLGKVQAEELRQLVERRIPILDVLGKMLGKTASELFKMAERGELSSELVIKAFRKMSGEGGRFENLMERMSNTVVGLWSNIKDNIFLTAIEFGDMIVQTFELKKVMDNIIKTLNKFKTLIQGLNPSLRKLVLGIVVFLATIGPLLLALGTVILTVKTLIVTLSALKIALMAFTLNPIVLGILAVIAVLLSLGVVLIQTLGTGETFFERMQSLLGQDIASWEHWGNTLIQIFAMVSEWFMKAIAGIKFGFNQLANDIELFVFEMLVSTALSDEAKEAYQAQVAELGKRSGEIERQFKKDLENAEKMSKIFIKGPVKAEEQQNIDKAVKEALGPIKKFSEIVDIRSEAAFLIRNNLQSEGQKNLAANEKTAANSDKMVKELAGIKEAIKKTKPVTTGI